MVKSVCRRRSWQSGSCACFCLSVGLVLFVDAGFPAPLAAQDSEDEQRQAAVDERAADRMIANIRSLVLPQQKELARELIRKYPQTHLAKLAQQLLDEYKLYDAVTAEAEQRAERRSQSVREYWRVREPYGPGVSPAPLRITNLSDTPMLYQVKGPAMKWTGPHSLRVGDTHVIKYPVTCRRVTAEGLVEYSLVVGRSYVFRRPAAGGLPRLYQARD